MVRQPRAQHAHFAGPRDVNQVGLEALQHFLNKRNMTQDMRDRSEDPFLMQR